MDEEITVERLERLYAESQDKPTPRMLPTIEIDDKLYFIDGRLRELRNVRDIDDRIDFDRFPSEAGPDIAEIHFREKEEGDY